jgi:NADPH:quinone reductase-like Zn-dependent oxidoreductase
LQGPPSFPYIPGGDCCGIVVEVAPNEPYFCVGDVVAARFTVAPRDALAQYARVSTSVCEVITDDSKQHFISPADAAALASASPAVVLGDYIRPHERLLIIGAGGGVGSHLCQVARGAAVVVGVSADPERLLQPPLLCHEAVDYTKENVFESIKYQNDPFDTIIDLACGGWPQLVECTRQGRPSIVKPASAGGRYITLCPDQPTFEIHGLWGILRLFMFRPLWRALTSRIVTRNRLPTFTFANGLPSTREILTRTLDLAARGQLQAVVDGPYPMTTDGVRAAFRTLQSRHAKGKVVIHVADLPPPPATTTQS